MEASEIQSVEVLEKLPEDNARSHGAGEGLSNCTSDTIRKTSAIMSIPEAIEVESSNSEIKEDDAKSEDTIQLSTSRWTTLARVFRVGLALDSAVPQNIKKIEAISRNEQFTETLSTNKRGSLGKLFRHGLKFNTKSFQCDNDFLAECPSQGYPKGKTAMFQNKRSTLQRLFRCGKSSHCLNEASSVELEDKLNVDENRLTAPARKFALGMQLRTKSTSVTKDDEKQTKSSGNIQHGKMSSVQLRRRSLGKLFKHSKDYHGGDFLASDHSKTSKNSNLPVAEPLIIIPPDEMKKTEKQTPNEG